MLEVFACCSPHSSLFFRLPGMSMLVSERGSFFCATCGTRLHQFQEVDLPKIVACDQFAVVDKGAALNPGGTAERGEQHPAFHTPHLQRFGRRSRHRTFPVPSHRHCIDEISVASGKGAQLMPPLTSHTFSSPALRSDPFPAAETATRPSPLTAMPRT